MAKLKLKKETFLKLLINPIFIISFVIFLNSFLFIYIKTSKNLTAKCYQQNKERPQKKACERYQNLSKEEKIVLNVTKISKKMKNKNLLSLEKKYYIMRKNSLV